MREVVTELLKGEDGFEASAQAATGHEAVQLAEQRYARELLDLARSSYQLRNDDNIHLGRIEAQVKRALREAAGAAPSNEVPSGRNLRARQLVGKPADP